MTSEIRNETIHSMKRRSYYHNYCRPGIYHITITTSHTLHQPLGRMAGRYDQTDDTAADAPHVELTAIGQMVKQELTTSISRYYPMLEVQDHVIMPEHLHFILVAHSDILTKGGRSTHLGQVLAGFKQGCNRLLRMTHRDRLQIKRRSADTAVTPSALRGYLQRECRYQYSEEAFNTIIRQLNENEVNEREHAHIVCDSYGNIDLLKRHLIPVVCHRRDAALFECQKEACMKAAAEGGVLVSARIAKGEQAILDAALHAGYPVVRIEDNGFPEIYHPSRDRINDCAAGRLLILTPWTYHFRGHDDSINVIFCKTMNCLVQALCKTKDDWWKG